LKIIASAVLFERRCGHYQITYVRTDRLFSPNVATPASR
jgi:hypothetical protein